MNVSDLEQIAEEVAFQLTALRESAIELRQFADNMPEPYYRVLGAIDTLECIVGPWAARIRAWIAANKESPQRKAFVEAAIEWNAQRNFVATLPPEPWQAIRDSHIHLSDAEAAMRETYRAMIEAEKVENK